MWLEDAASEHQRAVNEVAGRIRLQHSNDHRLDLGDALKGCNLNCRTKHIMNSFAIDYYRAVEWEASAEERLQRSTMPYRGTKRLQAFIQGACSKGIRGWLALPLFDERYASGYYTAEIDLKNRGEELRRLIREAVSCLTRTEPCPYLSQG